MDNLEVVFKRYSVVIRAAKSALRARHYLAKKTHDVICVVYLSLIATVLSIAERLSIT